MGARPGPRNFCGGGVVPKLPVTDFPVGAGAGREDREARHLPPLPGELHASGNGGSCSTKRGASGHSPRLDRNPHTWGDPGVGWATRKGSSG
jgi:hypothetical protein